MSICHICTGTCTGCKRVLGPKELELQAVMHPMMWELGKEVEICAREAGLFTIPPPHCLVDVSVTCL